MADVGSQPGFMVVVNGQIESGDFGGSDRLYCKYTFSFGPDWVLKEGAQYGITQIGQKSSGENNFIVWNFPLDATFKSTNAFGWPQLSISIFGDDIFGRDIARGYGSTHIPIAPGSYTRYIRTYAPLSSSLFQQYLNYIFGMRAEFIDPSFTAKNEGREVTRVASDGVVKVRFNVIIQDMTTFGYTEGNNDVSGRGLSWIGKQG